MKKHSAVLVFFVLFTCAGVVTYLFHIPLYTTMLHAGLISSYTERIYTIGDTSTSSIRYVPLGDSLTAGVGATTYKQAYPYILAEHLQRKTGTQILLKPHAIPGATTGDAIALLLDKVVASNPDVVTVLLGVNDVHKAVSAETFKYNYEYILTRLTHETHAKVYIINIPYIGASDLIVPPQSGYLDTRTREFNRILRELADTYRLPYIDVYTPMLLPSQEEGYYAKDRFHPSGKGYALWAPLLYDYFN